MTALDDAQVHLSKAREFLEAAEVNRDLALNNAATSDAVISGINSKDAICLTLTGRTNRGDNHTEAVSELKRAGRAGVDSALIDLNFEPNRGTSVGVPVHSRNAAHPPFRWQNPDEARNHSGGDL